jgi:hemerythrin-like domain-containing protein
MHAIELLLDDHEIVAGLFDRVRANQGVADSSLFEKIKAAIEVHKHIEETLFYPRLADEGDETLKKIVDTAVEEHRQVNLYLKELSELSDRDERFAPRLKMVMEDVEHHVEEEEERMFPLVENQFDEDALEKLGAQMEAEKTRYQADRFGFAVV